MRLLEKSNTLKVLNSIKESGDLYTGEELNDVANWIYDNVNRDSEWDKFTDDELVELISFCCITDKNPGGRAYDDEVFDAAERRPNGKELIKRGQLMAVGGDASKLRESGDILYYSIQDANNKGFYVKSNKNYGDVSDKNTLFKLLDDLEKRGFIDLDKKEDLEFARLSLARDEDEVNFFVSHGINCYDLTKPLKEAIKESVETFTDHTGKFDHDWFMNEVKLHIDNTYDVYEAACDKSRPAEAVANLAIQSAVNSCEPKPITWGQIKSRINKLGGDFEKVKADSIQAVEDFRKEMDEENALNESAKPVLSDKDKELLLKWGYPESDFRQIADAIRVTKYTLIDKDGKEKNISSEEARKMLGDEEFLSGISRSAFHWTAMRGTEDRGIHFDSSKLFESAKKLNESSDDLMWTSDSYAWVYDESDDDIMSEYKDATGEDAESADQAREYFFNDEFAWEVDKEDWDLNILPMIKEQTVNDIVILSGSIGLWHGNYKGGKVVDVNDLLDSMGDVDVIELHCDKSTNQLYLEGHHHDGTHSMYLYTIPKEQDKQLEFLNALGVVEWLKSIYDYDTNNYTAEEDALSRLSSAKELDDVIDSRGGFGDAMKLATPIVNN